MKCEYFLPSVVSELIESEKAIVTVLESEDKWYGVTYREDKPLVMNAIEKLKDEGIYPSALMEGLKMNKISKEELEEVINEFQYEGKLVFIKPYGSGHINDTFY